MNTSIKHTFTLPDGTCGECVHPTGLTALTPQTITDIIYYDDTRYWTGYKIITKDQKYNITIKICNGSDCCEEYGVVTFPKYLSWFVGATLTKPVKISSNLDGFSYTNNYNNEYYFIQIKVFTDRGHFRVRCYNEHNGYYTHSVFIEHYYGNKTNAETEDDNTHNNQIQPFRKHYEL